MGTVTGVGVGQGSLGLCLHCADIVLKVFFFNLKYIFKLKNKKIAGYSKC